MRPLAISVASGSVSSLLFAFARELVRAEVRNATVLPTEVCPLLREQDLFGEERGFDLRSLVVGIALGLCLGPCIDFLYYLRHFWGRAQAEVASAPRPLFRVLNGHSRGSGHPRRD